MQKTIKKLVAVVLASIMILPVVPFGEIAEPIGITAKAAEVDSREFITKWVYENYPEFYEECMNRITVCPDCGNKINPYFTGGWDTDHGTCFGAWAVIYECTNCSFFDYCDEFPFQLPQHDYEYEYFCTYTSCTCKICGDHWSYDGYINLVDENMSVTLSTSSVGTGTKINIVDNGEIIDSFDAVIFGDVNGDGWYDGTDAMKVNLLANGLLTKDDTGEAEYLAADCNHDGAIDNLDVEILEKAGLLLSGIDQTKDEEELLETTAYVEYLNLIDQTAETETTEVTEDEPVNPVTNPLSKIISFIKDLVAIIKAAVVFIKADMPGLPFSFKK